MSASEFAKTAKILITDDSATFRKMLRRILEDKGYHQIQEATNGREAWDLIKNSDSPFDLLLCDIHMPEINGLELLKKIRADERFKSVPLVLVTSESDKKVMAEGILAGASHYLTKPVTPEALFQRLAIVAEKFKK